MFLAGGQKALQAKPIPGRPPKLNAQQLAWLAQALRKHPEQYEFPFALWTLALVRDLIVRRFAQEVSLMTVRNMLRSLGFSVQRPTYRAWQQDAALVAHWEQEDYPAIQALARKAGATIYFGDESGMRSDYHTGTTWAPRGETPVVRATGRRFSLNMISAISPRGQVRFMTHTGTCTAVVFRDFLKRLPASSGTPVFLLVDGHAIHKAKLVRDFVATQEGRLRLFYLRPMRPNSTRMNWSGGM